MTDLTSTPPPPGTVHAMFAAMLEFLSERGAVSRNSSRCPVTQLREAWEKLERAARPAAASVPVPRDLAERVGEAGTEADLLATLRHLSTGPSGEITLPRAWVSNLIKFLDGSASVPPGASPGPAAKVECPDCHGEGFTTHGGCCGRCDGTGYAPKTPAAQAEGGR